ncbi:MAG: hypothetical protein AAFQ84_12580 [Pseudomonadota bacterium]
MITRILNVVAITFICACSSTLGEPDLSQTSNTNYAPGTLLAVIGSPTPPNERNCYGPIVQGSVVWPEVCPAFPDGNIPDDMPKVTIIGETLRPGYYSITESTTLSDIVLAARPYHYAYRHRGFFFRKGSEDRGLLRSEEYSAITLEDGDVFNLAGGPW